MLDNTYPQKDLKKGARLSGGGPTKPANGANKRPADSTPDPNLKKRRKDADLMPAPAVPVNTPAPKSDRPNGMTDLSSLPTSSLISYLVKHDVLPPVLPSPYTSQPALAPTSLLDPASTETPILTDLDAVHNVLAKLVERHWVNKSVRETDTLAGFMWCAQRARERNLLAASTSGHWLGAKRYTGANESEGTQQFKNAELVARVRGKKLKARSKLKNAFTTAIIQNGNSVDARLQRVIRFVSVWTQVCNVTTAPNPS